MNFKIIIRIKKIKDVIDKLEPLLLNIVLALEYIKEEVNTVVVELELIEVELEIVVVVVVVVVVSL